MPPLPLGKARRENCQQDDERSLAGIGGRPIARSRRPNIAPVALTIVLAIDRSPASAQGRSASTGITIGYHGRSAPVSNCGPIKPGAGGRDRSRRHGHRGDLLRSLMRKRQFQPAGSGQCWPVTVSGRRGCYDSTSRPRFPNGLANSSGIVRQKSDVPSTWSSGRSAMSDEPMDESSAGHHSVSGSQELDETDQSRCFLRGFNFQFVRTLSASTYR